MNGLILTALLLALGMAALLSGMEAGLFAISRFRIRRLARQGDRRALRLQGYLENPETFLWTILVGNTLATWVVVIVTSLQIHRWLGVRPGWFVVAVLGVLFLLYAFADLLPKLVFRRFPNQLCLACVGLFRMVHVALAPLVLATERVSRLLLRITGRTAVAGSLLGNRAELRLAIRESATSLSREELVMINRILELQNLRVRDVMTSIDKAATLDASATVADLLDLLVERQVSFVPLWKSDGAGRRVLGVVAVAGVIYKEKVERSMPLEALVQPASFVGETTRLEDALRVMQRGRQRLAVVLDARQAESGVVTLNDILGAMFGEVRI